MKLGSINIAVKDPDAALSNYVKMIGTNNFSQIVKFDRWDQAGEIVYGYYIKTSPIMIGLISSKSKDGPIQKQLDAEGEGINHIELHVGQDDLEALFDEVKGKTGVSEKIEFYGRLSEAAFWLEEDFELGVRIKVACKAYHGFGKEGAIYLDTPKAIESIKLEREIIRPRIELATIVIAAGASDTFESQHSIWRKLLQQPEAVKTKDALSESAYLVDDGRGNKFWPSSYPLQGTAKVSIYNIESKTGPIRSLLNKRNKQALYHNIIFLVTRDRMHGYWRDLENDGFLMVDPKPLLLGSTGNHFFFVHPRSSNGVTCEYVSFTKLNPKTSEFEFDWSDVNTYVVEPN